MRELQLCGTAAAVRRHSRHKEKLDPDCVEFERIRKARWREANREKVNAAQRAGRARRREASRRAQRSAWETERCLRLIARYAPDDTYLIDMLGLAA